jgi:hypothetical protein
MTAIQTAEWGFLSYPVHATIPAQVASLIGTAPWRDNAYLAFWDPARDMFGVAHVSTSPNAEGRRARFSVVAAGRAVEVVESLEPGTFTSESINFDLETSTITVTAPAVSAELVMSPRFVSADFSSTGLIPDLVEDVSLHHLEQGAFVRGSVTIGETATEVDGHGLRDRTWGPRDESTAWSEYAAIAACLRDFNLSVLKFRAMDGSTTCHGVLFGPESTTAITAVDINRDASGLIDRARLHIEDGREIALRMRRARGGFWVPMGAGGPPPTMSAYDDSVDFFADGSEAVIGAGFTEQGVLRRT